MRLRGQTVTGIKYAACKHCLKSKRILKGNWAWKICGHWEEYKIMEIDVDADGQLTSQKRRREATRLDSFIENDMTDTLMMRFPKTSFPNG
jgi:hypothetical protein